jgi:hypothetical protein
MKKLFLFLKLLVILPRHYKNMKRNTHTLPGFLNQKDRMIFRLGIMLLLVFLYACANVVAPTGGPRDEEPPVVIRSTPPNHSPNFTADQIRIYFDEFVELRNIRQQMLVSPPLAGLPDIRIRGRSVVIDIDEELRENTTYNFFFGDAIRDITEGNAIPNFQFVFSTGDYVDSLSVRGKVINAFTHEPEDGVFVMMYDSIMDSIPYLERPVYLAKTDKDGLFTIGNMRGGDFLMFALKDNNANFLYDLPDEKIAFLDSLVRPEFVKPKRDMIGGETDVIGEEIKVVGEETEVIGKEIKVVGEEKEFVGEDLDLIEEQREGNFEAPFRDAEPHFYTLFLFQEPDTAQRVTSYSVVQKGLVQMTFRVPYDSVYVRDIRPEKDTADWHIPAYNTGRDTLSLWITDPLRDSLFIEVIDRGQVLDTLKRSARPRAVRGREADAEEEIIPLDIKLDGPRGRAWPFFRPLALMSGSPVETIDPEKISIMKNDTIPVYWRFETIDRVRRTLRTDSMPEQDRQYRIKALPGAFTDVFGVTNDTLIISFRTSNIEDYGKLIMNMHLPGEDGQYILQLLSRDARVLAEKILMKDGTYTFSHLQPGQYRLRLIDDRNKNGKWDTGIYLKKQLPEPVFIFQEEIQIRQNWEMELPWDLRLQ